MPLLTFEQIQAAGDVGREVVSIPEWGGDVLVQGLTGAGRIEFNRQSFRREGDKFEADVFYADLVLASLCLVNEAGSLLFPDVKTLGGRSSIAIERIVRVARRLSGMDRASAEDAEKKSEATPSGGSGSS
jgi:hypothetical protein